MLNSEFSEYCGNGLEKIRSIGYASEVFLRGFFCPQDDVLPCTLPLPAGEVHKVTGSFPRAWQLLTAAERAYRSQIGTDVDERIPLLPIRRGLCMDAQDIIHRVKSQRAQAEADREELRRRHPKLNEDALVRLGKLTYPEIKPSVFWQSGREVTVVAIDWGSFTNDEIANYFRRWLKENRPKEYPVPNRKGHKSGDWRANLKRLAAMRLLSRFTASQIFRQRDLLCIWQSKQFAGDKWCDTTKWHQARREAGKLFRKLFPFLPRDERPLSWTRPAPAK